MIQYTVNENNDLQKEILDKLSNIFTQDDIEDAETLEEFKHKLASQVPEIKCYFVDGEGIEYCDNQMQTLFEYSISRNEKNQLVHTFEFYDDDSIYNYVEDIIEK